jgi:cytochrome P450
MYAALRDRNPVHDVVDGNFYVLTRFADVWAAAGDPATFSSARGLTVTSGDATPMVFLDQVPPEDRVLFDRWTEAIVQAAASSNPTAAGDRFSELLAFAFTMVTGGNDTITGMLSGSSCLLTEHPDQRALLIARPELILDAVEELLRLTSPVQNLARTTTRAVVLHDVTIPAGKKALLGYAAANRDDREFGPTAEALAVTRTISKILTLSYGTYYCIGAAAARLQARVVLEELLARCPDFRVDVDAGVYAPGAECRLPARPRACLRRHPMRTGPGIVRVERTISTHPGSVSVIRTSVGRQNARVASSRSTHDSTRRLGCRRRLGDGVVPQLEHEQRPDVPAVVALVALVLADDLADHRGLE